MSNYDSSNTFARAWLVQTRHVTEYSSVKTEEYQRDFSSFQNFACYGKYLKDNKHNNLHLAWKYILAYFSLDIICSSKLTVFLELRLWKTVRFSEQIMSADKYSSIFSRQMEATVYINIRVKLKFFLIIPCSTNM